MDAGIWIIVKETAVFTKHSHETFSRKLIVDFGCHLIAKKVVGTAILINVWC